MRRSAAALLAIPVVVLAACSGDGDVATTTVAVAAAATTPATTPATTVASAVAPVATEPLFPSVSGFVAAFVAVGESGASGAEPFPLTLEGLTTGALPIGGDGFISVDAIPNGLIGGTSDADGAVTAAFVFLDPLTSSAAPAVVSLLGSTIASSAEFDQAGFAQEYRALALEASARAGEQEWIPSVDDSGYSIVASVVAGADGGRNLIEVAIVPYGAEADAKAAVKPIRNAVIGLVAE